MVPTKTLRDKSRLFVSIFWPIFVTQAGFYAMNLIDTMMSGRVGTADLAGVAVGANLWMPVFTGINGILMAVTPIVAQHVGAGQRDKIGHAVTQSLYLSVVLALVVIAAGAWALKPVLSLLELEPAVEHIALHYLVGLSIGIWPMFAAHVLRYFFDAQGYTRISMVMALVALPFNVLFNYGLIFGQFGLPRMGGIGAGYATAATYWLIFAFSVLAVLKVDVFRSFRLFVKWAKPSFRAWKEQMAIGIPIGLSIFFETSIFAVVSILMAVMFDTVTIAAHQAAISFTSLLFMIPLSLSMAITILVGYEVGAGRFRDARQYGWLGVLGAMGILAVSSVFLYWFREPIASLYTENAQVVVLASQFLLFAIIYQLSDAAQVSLQGVLRGYKDVTIPFVIALVSYWGIGLPAGHLLTVHTGLGPFGYWIGITIGLTCAAIGFLFRLAAVQRKYSDTLISQPDG